MLQCSPSSADNVNYTPETKTWMFPLIKIPLKFQNVSKYRIKECHFFSLLVSDECFKFTFHVCVDKRDGGYKLLSRIYHEIKVLKCTKIGDNSV